MLKLNPAAHAPAGAVAASSLQRARTGLPPDEAIDAVQVPHACTAPATAHPGAPTGDMPVAGAVAVLLLADIAPRARAWGWSRVVRGSRPLQGEPGLRWAKVMGSGQGGGFSARPSLSHQGVFAVFDNLASAQAFVRTSPRVATYRQRSSECLTALLQPWSARGSWGGQTLDVPPGLRAPGGPVVALTRASIHALKAVPFWRLAPAAQASLHEAPGCSLAAGLGEAPWLRQCTVSVWDSVSAMDAYARSGAHLAAIRAAAAGGYFSESMFVRFRLLAIEGRWQGRPHG